MRIIIVSNRLPVTVTENSDFVLSFEASSGGLVTGIFSYLKKLESSGHSADYIWIGSVGSQISMGNEKVVKEKLAGEYNAIPVFLSNEEIDRYYHGFSNNTLWPLFHYFPVYTEYDEDTWESYNSVNLKFAHAVEEHMRNDDILWIHDYQLMLLPGFIRKFSSSATIGYFHHIPFPSYEIFRLLPGKWRIAILEGLLGADLIGFHTSDYSMHFVSCVLRILGHDSNLGSILLKDRMIRADTFPMGIEYSQFHDGVMSDEVKIKARELKSNFKDKKIILSVDRLDYSKGILNRLEGYEKFLESHQEWHDKLVMVIIVVPSRVNVTLYAEMKRQIDETIGKINGKFGKIGWSPIVYQFRSMKFNELLAAYNISDIALVTPLRDGMNLIAKEYIASQTDQTGVLILSEMAGASRELGEAIIINPNHREEISEAIYTALHLSEDERRTRLLTMQSRIKRYDVIRWASDFFSALTEVKKEQQKFNSRMLNKISTDMLLSDYSRSRKRFLALDYDGTLVGFASHPDLAVPGEYLLRVIRMLTQDRNNELYIVSGRDRAFLEKHLGNTRVGFIAEHGAWIKKIGEDWIMPKTLQDNWMDQIESIMQLFSDRLPGSFIERKMYSVAIHYRRSDYEYSSIRIKELADELINYTANINVQVLHGNKVLEVRNAGVNKGEGVLEIMKNNKYDFILCIGDDWTDEDMFQALPPEAYTVKVGSGSSHARFNINSTADVVYLLENLDVTISKIRAPDAGVDGPES
jgi:trehalose 6-phosphate synthase/phosphatase